MVNFKIFLFVFVQLWLCQLTISQEAVVKHNGAWLKFHTNVINNNTQQKNYTDAKQECEKDNASLVIIKDDQTQQAINKQLSNWERWVDTETINPVLSQGYWAGGTNEVNQTVWLWEDGSALPCDVHKDELNCTNDGFSYWLKDEPNNYMNSANHGLSLAPLSQFNATIDNGATMSYTDALGKWVDDDWGRPRNYICQKGFCADQPCQNGGNCTALENNYQCNCAVGWLGDNCTVIDPCTSSPCMNNGTCHNINETSNFTCECVKYYYGEICNQTICEAADPCQNNGTCLFEDSNYNCTCMGEYTGYNCSIDPCFNRTCENNGTCYISNYTSQCNCTQEFQGDNCQIKRPKNNEVWIPIVAGTLGGVALLVIIAVIVYCCLKQRTPPKQENPRPQPKPSNNYTPNPVRFSTLQSNQDNEDEYADTIPQPHVAPHKGQPDYTIQAEALLSYCLHTLEQEEFTTQFKSLPDVRSGRITLDEIEQKYVNDGCDDIPYPSCALSRESTGNRGPRSGINWFVLSPYPTIDSAHKYWEMVKEESCSMIIVFGYMNTDVECFPPNNETKKYGTAIVKTVSEEPHPFYVIREFELQFDDTYHSAQTFEFKHIQWTAEGSVYDAMKHPKFFDFFNAVQAMSTRNACGVRASISANDDLTEASLFIAYHSLVSQLHETQSVNVYQTVADMRKTCSGMIHSQEYYMFLHQAIAEYHTLLGGNCRRKNFNLFYESLCGTTNVAENTTGFDSQLQKLDTLRTVQSLTADTSYEVGRNTQKQKAIAKSKDNKFLTFLSSNGENIRYRGVVFEKHGYFSKVIATKVPSEKEIDKFWLCVFHAKVEGIVMITQLHERDGNQCAQYWPTELGQQTRFGNVIVEIQNEKSLTHYITRRDMLVHHNNETLEVVQYDYIGWPLSGAPERYYATDIVVELGGIRLNKPVLVQCNNGVNRTGAFICLVELVYNLTTGTDIDIARSVNNIRKLLPDSVPTVKQLCYLVEEVKYLIEQPRKT